MTGLAPLTDNSDKKRGQILLINRISFTCGRKIPWRKRWRRTVSAQCGALSVCEICRLWCLSRSRPTSSRWWRECENLERKWEVRRGAWTRARLRLISEVGVDGGRSWVSSVNTDSVFTFIRNIELNLCLNNSINLIRMIQNIMRRRKTSSLLRHQRPLWLAAEAAALSGAEVQHYPREKVFFLRGGL